LAPPATLKEDQCLRELIKSAADDLPDLEELGSIKSIYVGAGSLALRPQDVWRAIEWLDADRASVLELFGRVRDIARRLANERFDDLSTIFDDIDSDLAELMLQPGWLGR
jgi:hypothetical protein